MPESPSKLVPHPARRAHQQRADRSVDQPPYAELQVTTNFTFLTGASHADELADRAAALGYRGLAVTDTNTLAGVVRMHVAAKQAGVPLAIGCRLLLAWHDDRQPFEVLVYPTTREAYGRLCALLTRGKLQANKGECHLTLHDLLEAHEDLLAVIVPPETIDSGYLDAVTGLRQVFGCDRLSLAATCPLGADDADRLAQLAQLAEHVGLPLAATNDVQYHSPSHKPLHDVLACIRGGVTLDEAGPLLRPNAEQHLKEPAQMHQLFVNYPDAIRRSVAIIERASRFSLDELRYEYPHETCPPGASPMTHLRELTRQGVAEHYSDGLPAKVHDQIEHELELIEALDYPHYFLTVHDIVDFARSRGILCQGRGAAANSAVCFCLGITEVDPARSSMLFERFISKERDEPPDIDVDFE
ncbi:MAG: PHP domain-containing protein, partial [Phycisphaeraceae bacterium]